MPNIIGGKYKRTKLAVPNKLVRPTSALKREAIFSIKYDFFIPLEIASSPINPEPANISIIDLFLYISIERCIE